MELSVQRSAKIKSHRFRKAVKNAALSLLFVSLRDETRESNSERKRGKKEI